MQHEKSDSLEVKAFQAGVGELTELGQKQLNGLMALNLTNKRALYWTELKRITQPTPVI